MTLVLAAEIGPGGRATADADLADLNLLVEIHQRCHKPFGGGQAAGSGRGRRPDGAVGSSGFRPMPQKCQTILSWTLTQDLYRRNNLRYVSGWCDRKVDYCPTILR